MSIIGQLESLQSKIEVVNETIEEKRTEIEDLKRFRSDLEFQKDKVWKEMFNTYALTDKEREEIKSQPPTPIRLTKEEFDSYKGTISLLLE